MRKFCAILFSTGLLVANLLSAQTTRNLPSSSAHVAPGLAAANSTLSGTYVFLLHGFVGGLNTSSAGTFTADGDGHIVDGSVDISTGSAAVTTLPFTGSYTAVSANQFSLTLGIAGGPINIPLYLGALNASSVATKLRAELGTGASAESGVFYLRDAALSAQGPLQAGSFVLGVSGSTASGFTTAAGRFDTTAGGAIANGQLDAFSQVGSTPVQVLNAAPFTGTLSAPQTSQHLSATFNLSSLSAHFNVYPVTNNQLLFVQIDSLATGLPPLSGVALRQIDSSSSIEIETRGFAKSLATQSYGFTNASLKGTSVFSLSGPAGSSGSLSAVGLFAFDGSASFKTNAVQEVGGKVGSVTLEAASYSVADNGRLVMGSPGSPVALGYVTDTGQAFLVSAATTLSSGFFEPQTTTAIDTQTLAAGGYLFGSTSSDASQSQHDAGVATLDGNGNVTSYVASDSGAGSVSGAGLVTYTIDSTGLLNSNVGLTGYLVSTSRFIALLPSSTFGAPLVFDQASTPSTSPLTPTTSSLTTSSNSVMAGASITLTATVNPSAATGSVTFYDGSSSLGSAVTLNAGVASLSTSSLAVGTHIVTAVYGGDASYAGSTAPSLNIIVTPPDNSQVAGTSNPQVAAYTVTLQEPGTVSVDFGTTTSYGLETSAQHFVAGAPAIIYVAGMLQNTTYHMRAVIAYDNGTTATDPDHTFATGTLPSGIIPQLTVTQTNGLTPQPGIELLDLLQGSTIGAPSATDLKGNVIWTYLFPDRQTSSILYPIKLQPNGHFIALIAEASQLPVTVGPVPSSSLNVLREFDLAGNIIRQLSMAQLNAGLSANGFNLTLQVFSHDFAVLPNGHILVIANTLKTFTNLTGLPGNTTVLGDVVVDLDTNFKPVWVWNEFDHFDVNRHPFQFPDWTHSNAIAYSQDDGNFLISIRHQNWIVKVDYNNGAGAGDVIWKLGYQGDFKLEGAVDPTDWFYAQHDVNFVSSNTTGNFQIAVMDNGDDRVFPTGVQCSSAGAPPCQYTTSQVLQVDENAKTASFLFHQIVPTNLYSSFAGDNRVQPNGDVEYNLAGVGSDSYVFEVTPTANPQTVWEMHIENTNTYRAFRIPSLYPGVQW